MSREEEKKGGLTVMVVPHDRERVRTLRLSGRTVARLKVVGVTAAALIVGGLATFMYLLRQAQEVSQLRREREALLAERVQLEVLLTELEEMGKAYEQIKQMAGVTIPIPALDSILAGDGRKPTPDERPPLEQRRVSGASEEWIGTGTPSIWPLTSRGFVTNRFSGLQEHTGIDIAVPSGTPVQAAAGGIVLEAGWDATYGYYVLIQHDRGYTTLYGHCDRLFVEAGESVRRYQIMAYSGNTGRSSAPHLHYEVRQHGVPVDPRPFLGERRFTIEE